MAETTKQQAVIASVRDALSDAYGFVRGSEYTRKVGQVTYEQMVDSAIAKIRGTPGIVTTRPCKLDRIEAVRANLVAVIEQVKGSPVEMWAWGTDQDVADEDKANTPEKG